MKPYIESSISADTLGRIYSTAYAGTRAEFDAATARVVAGAAVFDFVDLIGKLIAVSPPAAE